ncbi:MAG: chain length-determining protein [Gammaproteobacteria bacterium]|nr:chain length-determining protein [Gammaproteobacteria bacterium]
MYELVNQLLGYIRGIWRYRWWILGVAWTVSIIGWIQVSNLPDQFKASARVYVDTTTLLQPLLRGLAVEGNDQHQLLLMTNTLMSRPNLEKVMRMADLDLKAKTEADTEELINELKENFSLQSAGRVNLYTIAYQDARPELAKLLVKSLLTIFVESNIGETRKEQDSARQFLEQQIAEYEQRLVEAEERKTRFQQKNLAFLPNERGDYYSRLQTTQEQLAQAELDLKIQQDRLAVLQQQIEDEEGIDPLEGVGEESFDQQLEFTSELDPRIARLESNLDDMLLRYTEQHPDVVATRLTLKTLKEKRAAELAQKKREAAAAGLSSSMIGSNPVYQEMRIVMSEVEADIAAKTAIVEEYKKRIENLSAAVDKVLQVETEEAQLNRDYGILQQQHQALLSRLESARLSHDVDVRSGTVRFRIVDPPSVPLTPSGPPRALLSSLVVLGGLLLGVVLAFLMSQIRPTYDDRDTLNSNTGFPVLGSVSMVWTNAQIRIRQRRHLGFLLGLLALVSAYGFVMFLYISDVDPVWMLKRLQEMASV